MKTMFFLFVGKCIQSREYISLYFPFYLNEGQKKVDVLKNVSLLN